MPSFVSVRPCYRVAKPLGDEALSHDGEIEIGDSAVTQSMIRSYCKYRYRYCWTETIITIVAEPQKQVEKIIIKKTVHLVCAQGVDKLKTTPRL